MSYLAAVTPWAVNPDEGLPVPARYCPQSSVQGTVQLAPSERRIRFYPTDPASTEFLREYQAFTVHYVKQTEAIHCWAEKQSPAAGEAFVDLTPIEQPF